MSTAAIVVIAVAAVLLLLFLGGLAGNARRRARVDDSLRGRIAEADRALAAARAEDRGWDPALLERAARDAAAARGITPTALELVQVVDRPGTEEDEARMRVAHAGGVEEIQLRRSGDSWSAA